MFRNYFKTSIRNLLRNKGYTIINITGLSAGIAVCLTIYLFIRFESGFDGFHEKKDRIYRVLTKYDGAKYGSFSLASGVPYPLPGAIRKDFPQLEKTAGITSLGERQVLVLDSKQESIKKFKTNVFFTEPSFFDIFDFKPLAGNPAEILNDPNSAILTKETAEKYFGNWKSAIGRTIKIDDRFLFKITAVLASVPANTDFQLEIIVPYSVLNYSGSQDWFSISSEHQCYVLAPPGLSVTKLDKQLGAFSKKYRAADDKNTQLLQPLGEVHYSSGLHNFNGKTITKQHIRTLWLIAAFILLIACINFINLSTAQAINRAKEVGVRKVLGSNKSQLTVQFLLETMLLVVVAVVLAVFITAFSLKAISKILGDPLSLKMLFDPVLLLFLAVITILVTALAGGYPSLVLSGFKPVTALKSKIYARSTRGISLRRGLVVFQFIIAQTLIIATLIILKQMHYMRNSSMGFKADAVVNIPFPNDSAGISKIDYLRDQLNAVKGVQQISFSDAPPARGKEARSNQWTDFLFDHAAKPTDFFSIIKWIDHNYIKTYQLTLVAGRNITATDSVREFLVNEDLAKKLGFSNPEDILNKEINVFGGYSKGPIVGVVKDFNLFSLKEGMGPVFMSNVKRSYSMAGIKLASSGIFDAMKSIEKIWSRTYPNYVFDYQFLDDRVAGFYKQESQLSQLYQLFAAIAIFLSCLGLFGLASFMALQRKKEVGIRKVLGATEGAIIYLFSKEFIFLIGIAFIIASSVTWYFMHQWLQNYAYHINIGGWVFIAGGGISLIIALMTISFHATKAAITDPVKNLRSE